MNISQPSTNLKAHYDVIVVGSGYGASVAASRLSRSGKQVVVLEQGREFVPSDHKVGGPTNLLDANGLNINGRKLGAKDQGFTQMTMSDDIGVISGTGLGGGSIINAAVMVKPDERVFQDKRWPAALRREYKIGKMDKYYDRAREMLGVVPYPNDVPKTGKSLFFEQAVKDAGMGDSLQRPDLAVNFNATGSNHFGIPQAATDFSGAEILGNPNGAKNSTTKNYLPDALKHGAEIFCGIHVQRIQDKNDRGDYTVYFHDYTNTNAKELAVRAPMIVLGAGTLGTSGILLRSKGLLDMKAKNVGQRFSANGATVAMLTGGKNVKSVKVTTRGSGRNAGRIGVYIDNILQLKGKDDPKHNVMIEESSWHPSLLSPVLNGDLGVAIKNIGSTLRDLSQNTSNTIPLMCLGHDDGDAEIILDPDGGYPVVRWNSTEIESESRAVMRETFQKLATAIGGSYEELPAFVRPLSKRVTAHPLGGAVMSDDPETGLVDSSCHLYRENGSVHKDFLIVDGSVMPTSLACNPALTITALAERAIQRQIESKSMCFDFTLAHKQISKAMLNLMHRDGADVEFNEKMAGDFMVLGRWRRSQVGKHATSSPLEFNIKITINSLEDFMNHEEDGHVSGSVSAPSLSLSPLTVLGGAMRIFVHNDDDIHAKQMQYELPMTSTDGRQFRLVGYKNLVDENGINCIGSCAKAYIDTTNLQYELYEEEKVIGQGLLKISFWDILKMNGSIRGKESGRFRRYFMGNLAEIYMRAFLPKKTPAITDPVLPIQRVIEPTRNVHTVTTQDGIELPLHRYMPEGAPKGVIITAHGGNVRNNIFAADTIDKNVVEAFCEEGFDVWNVCLRFGMDVETKGKDFTLESIGQFDYPAIFDYIEKMTDPSTRTGGIQVYTQCLASPSLCISILGGHLAAERVKSICFSQIGFSLSTFPFQKMEANARLPNLLKALGMKTYHSPRDPDRNAADMFLDFLASYVIPTNNRYRSDSVEQARSNFIFGELWNSEQMDGATIERMRVDFGSLNLTCLVHIVACCRIGNVVNAKEEDIYRPRLEKLAEIPITFQWGTENKIFKKDGVVSDHHFLHEVAKRRGWVGPKGAPLHNLIYAEGHGHLDHLYGKTAQLTAYPAVIEHFNKWNSFDTRPWSCSWQNSEEGPRKPGMGQRARTCGARTSGIIR